jgi:hypothetical protein
MVAAKTAGVEFVGWPALLVAVAALAHATPAADMATLLNELRGLRFDQRGKGMIAY